jgi:hypothetical protein
MGSIPDSVKGEKDQESSIGLVSSQRKEKIDNNELAQGNGRFHIDMN